jgi:RNA polymerase-binding transcription factor DksA
MAAAKKTAAKKAPAKKAAVKTPAAKATKAPATKAPATKNATKAAAKTSRPAKQAAPVKKTTGKAATVPTSAKKAPPKAPPKTTSKAPAKPVAKASAATNGAPSSNRHPEIPEPRGVSKDGIAYTKDFDVKFLKTQRDALETEKARLMGQAIRLEDEAHSPIEEAEMGDVQFDDEGGEGDTMVVERERDLALSAQARQTIADIDAALERIEAGTYGYSEVSGRPIPRERLEAIPWATVLVEEKVGGIGRR